MRGSLLTSVFGLCALVACGEAQAPPPATPTPVVVGQTPPSPAPGAQVAAPAGSCVLRGDRETGQLRLMHGGRTFAVLDDYAEWVEVHVAHGSPVARAIVHGKSIDVVGDVAVSELRVAPRARPTGWALPTKVRVRSVTATGDLVGEIDLPRVSATSMVGTSFRCADLALGRPAWASAPLGGTPRLFKPGATAQMLDAPGGQPVGQLKVPTGGSFLAYAHEERSGAVRLSVDDAGTIAEFWVSSDVLRPDTADNRALTLTARADAMQLQLLAATGSGSLGTSCAHPINIYVRDGSTAVAVGSLRPGAVMRRASAAPQAQGEVPIDLGSRDPAGLVPFVLTPDVDGCTVPSRQPIATVVPGRGLATSAATPPPSPALGGSSQTSIGAPRADDRRVQGPTGAVQLSVAASAGDVPDVERVLAGARGRMRHCYQKGLDSDPTMRGKVALTVRVAPNGEVMTADVTMNQGLSSVVASCAAAVTRRMRFSPTSSGASATLVISSTFSRAP